MNVEWWGGEQSSPPADYKSALLDCRVQLGAPSPALLCFRFVWLYLKWLGSLLGWAGLPKGWPAALTTRRARRSRAQGHRARLQVVGFDQKYASWETPIRASPAEYNSALRRSQASLLKVERSRA